MYGVFLIKYTHTHKKRLKTWTNKYFREQERNFWGKREDDVDVDDEDEEQKRKTGKSE